MKPNATLQKRKTRIKELCFQDSWLIVSSTSLPSDNVFSNYYSLIVHLRNSFIHYSVIKFHSCGYEIVLINDATCRKQYCLMRIHNRNLRWGLLKHSNFFQLVVSAALPEVSMITYKSDQNLFFWTPFSFTTDSKRSSFSSAGTLQCCMTSCSIAMMSECSIRVRALAFFAWELYPLIPEKNGENI